MTSENCETIKWEIVIEGDKVTGEETREVEGEGTTLGGTAPGKAK